MLSLTEKLPNELFYEENLVSLDLSFDTVLLWFNLLDETGLTEEEKINTAFENFVLNTEFFYFEDRLKIIEEISSYISSQSYGQFHNDEYLVTNSEKEMTREPVTRYFSYSKDAEAIYASFYQNYQLDLIECQGSLHWAKFSALLTGLSEDTLFKRILSIRQANPSNFEGQALMDLLEAQNHYALDEEDTAKNLDNQIGNIFNLLKVQAENGGE